MSEPVVVTRREPPLYLLADSQLLFWRRNGRLLLESAIAELDGDTSISAAYIGASNGDHPEHYGIFEAAMDAVGITDRRMITSSFGREDRTFLRHAQLIVLAGGDVRVGWSIFQSTGMKDAIVDRHARGAVLVGISAGAVQLGRYGIVEPSESSANGLLDVFDLVPMVIDVHDEQGDWTRLRHAVCGLEGAVTGLGIPSGGGAIVRADTAIEPLRRPAHRFRYEDGHVTHSASYPAIDD